MQNVRLFWQKTENGRAVQFEGAPFSVAESKLLDCQFGPKYFKQKPIKGKKLWLQSSRKIGCKACVEVILYPEFNISKSERDGLTKWKLRKLQEDRIHMIREDLQLNKPIKKVNKYFISIPGENLHSGHLTGTTGVFSQKLNPEVSLKIVDMVQSGITDVKEIKCSLKYYVNTSLCKKLGANPVPGDRAFYPLSDDIRNHVTKAKRAFQLSRYDQDNLRLKIEEWRKKNPQSSFFFRPYHETSEFKQTNEDCTTLTKSEKKLLFVHQEDWQKELLVCYGNMVTLMDATYKTTKYSLPLFFVRVKTNVSYSVVAEFIIQSETSDDIFEALSVLKA